MPFAPATNRSTRIAAIPGNALRVSTHDRVSGLLAALLILVGAGVLMMFIIWLSGASKHKHGIGPIETWPGNDGESGALSGSDLQLDEPTASVVSNAEAPAETLREIKGLVSTQAESINAVGDASRTPSQGARRYSPGNRDGSIGRTIGASADIIPRHRRWTIHYHVTGIGEFARQLDHFGIELGAVHLNRPEITYAAKLSQPSSEIRRGERRHERRLYFISQYSVIADWTNRLLMRAGIDVTNTAACQFFSAETENTLALLEWNYAGKRDVREIRSTVFGIRPAGGGYEFYVIRQQFRKKPL